MKKLTVAYVIVFIALLLLPSLTMPLFSDDGSTENRTLAQFPSLIKSEGGLNENYTDELDDYISDHIGFRRMLASANSIIQSSLFGRSSEEKIIVGKDGWLFYAETKNDYLNAPTLSRRNINNIVHTLELWRDKAEADGATFTVAIIPNKNTVYPDKMPFYYIPQKDDGNLELLTGALKESGITYADVKSAIETDEDTLYQRTDSHWDYRGALTGYRSIMEKANFPYKVFDGLTFTARDDWSGDLAVMLYADSAAPDTQYYPDTDFGYDIVSHEKAPDAITLRTRNPNGEGNLVMYRDSFCNTMHVYFADSFKEAVFSRAYPFETGLVERYDADVCILEIVERNIPNLAAKAPVMEAVKTELSVSAKRMEPGSVEIFTEVKNGNVHVYGTVDEKYLGTSNRIYLLAEVDGKTQAYEAFPIFEQELLETAELGDNGFSAYFPKDLWESFSSVRVAVYNGEEYRIGE